MSRNDAVELFVVLKSTPGTPEPASFRATSHTAADTTERPIEASQTRVTWSPAPPPKAAAPAPLPASLAGGDPTRGEAVFFGDDAKCSACHVVNGKGHKVGPDLTNEGKRDIAAIFRDIAEPSAAIHPDYVPYTVITTDGRVLAGVVRVDAGGVVRVVDTNAVETQLKRDEIEDLRPTSTSIMPVGLVGVLGETRMRDLLAFLAAQKSGEAPPPPR